MIRLLTGAPGLGLSSKLIIMTGLLLFAWGGAWLLQDYGETRAERDVAIQVNQANAENLRETLRQIERMRAREGAMRSELDALHAQLGAAQDEIMRMEEEWLDYPLKWSPPVDAKQR